MFGFSNFNKVVLVGRLTRDVELRHIPSGTAVAEIGLAVNNRKKNQQGEWEDEVSFIDVTLWNRDAEMANDRLTKGSPVMIEGRLQQDRWEQDGQKRSKVVVVANQVIFLDSNGGGGGSHNQSNSYSQSNNYSQGGGNNNQSNNYNQGGGDQGYNQNQPAQNAPADGGFSDAGESEIPF
ncbi:MAG: single-stranded DNA-binding protein [Pirellulaceae bacterium]